VNQIRKKVQNVPFWANIPLFFVNKFVSFFWQPWARSKIRGNSSFLIAGASIEDAVNSSSRLFEL
jgi:hypothetical protein